MPRLLDIIESLWLIIGPCLNHLHPQQSLTSGEHNNYDDIITSLRVGDGPAVRKTIERSIDERAEL